MVPCLAALAYEQCKNETLDSRLFLHIISAAAVAGLSRGALRHVPLYHGLIIC